MNCQANGIICRTELAAPDRRILRALQHNGRLQNVDLARQVGLSPSLRRMRLREEAGVIERHNGSRHAPLCPGRAWLWPS